MQLNNTTLRDILVAIFNVDEDYIIPKMGNWFNPQSMLPTVENPMTWIAYKVLSNDPVTIPFYESETIDDELVNYVRTYKIANIELQFVGTQSEALANGVAFWIKRNDVAEQFETVGGKLMADDWKVRTIDFYQDGNNNIFAYLVRLRILWIDEILTTQEICEGITSLDGEINIT